MTVQPLAATRDALADTQRADASAHTTPETAAVPAAAAGEILPRYRALYEKNPDLIGWLRIDGTDIDLPVVQTPGDNEYYLRRGFDRFYAVGGTLFLDERCSVSADAPTANWLIYGHNMHDGSMFGQLVRYRDEDFYKAHPTFTFDTLYEGGTWQVVAAVDTALGADALPYYTFFDADTKLDWQHRVRAITEKALYDTGVMPEYGAQLLTLLDLRRPPPRHRRPLCPAGRADRLILLLHFPAESAMMLLDPVLLKKGVCNHGRIHL